MYTFAFAVLLLISTPGPGVLSAAGVGAGFGFRAGLRYVLGLFLGNNIVATAVLLGVSAVITGVPVVRNILLVASAIYLFYLAGRIAFAGSRIAFIEARIAPGIWSGVVLQIINPKAYIVSTTLFSGFAFMPDNLPIEVALKLSIFNVIWIPLHILWLWAGATLHRLNLSERAQRQINYLMALAMLAVVGLALISGSGS